MGSFRSASSVSIRSVIGAGALIAAATLFAPAGLKAQQLSLEATRPANLVVPPPGQSHTFTNQECRAIAAATTEVLKRVDANSLSREFRQSMVDFIMHGGSLNCAGPRVIAWRTQTDAATFNNIATLAQSPSAGVWFGRAGVVLAPTPVASLKLQ